ncbi:MAG: hypothetical protein ACREQF_02190 [Candidatus Binataceae bacterium]
MGDGLSDARSGGAAAMMFGYTIYRNDPESPEVLASRLYEMSVLRDEMASAEMSVLRERYPESNLECKAWTIPSRQP